MNLTKMFKIQKELDERIVKEKDLKGVDLLDKKILSLQVELGELANELPEVFKFWSNKKNNYKKALEEYCDCLHFILSIGLETLRHGQSEIHLIQIYLDGMRDVPSFAVGNKKEIVSVFRELFKITSEIGNSDFKLKELIGYFDTLGGLLGFTREQIETAYMQKNKINHARQENGY